jgi:hypothetical protein
MKHVTLTAVLLLLFAACQSKTELIKHFKPKYNGTDNRKNSNGETIILLP